MEENSKKAANTGAMVFVVVIAAVILIGIWGFHYASTNPDKSGATIAAITVLEPSDIKAIIEAGRDKNSTDISIIDNVVEIKYYSNTIEIPSVLSITLMPKIKSLYEKYPPLKNCKFHIIELTQDKYGHQSWKQQYSFEFSRNLYNKIDWNHIDPMTLPNIAENVTEP